MSNPNWSRRGQRASLEHLEALTDPDCITLEEYNRQRAKETTECPKQGKTTPTPR